MRMTFANIGASWLHAYNDCQAAEKALIALAGEQRYDYIVITANVFRKLVEKNDPLEAAHLYYLKQGWKLADNYELEEYIQLFDPIIRTAEWRDFIEAVFRFAIIEAVERAYKTPANRTDKGLQQTWERYGYHVSQAVAA